MDGGGRRDDTGAVRVLANSTFTCLHRSKRKSEFGWKCAVSRRCAR
jgi:hypothetical protein